ncbi:MAG TPA: hypothetical protein VJ740_14685 [Hyphomicrobiaceae bacterium]|nr:hypothetical protein [Hyphomicrobiaceae bacterium]
MTGILGGAGGRITWCSPAGGSARAHRGICGLASSRPTAATGTRHPFCSGPWHAGSPHRTVQRCVEDIDLDINVHVRKLRKTSRGAARQGPEDG